MGVEMRFVKINFLLASLLLVSAIGCQNSASNRCQRETALLRAEILDLEDKYYALQAQQRMAGAPAAGSFVTNNVIGSGVVSGGVVNGGPVVVGAPWPVEGQVISGDVIYDDQMVNGVPIQAPYQGEVYYDGQVYGDQVYGDQVYGEQVYDGQTYEGQIYDAETLPLAPPVIDSGSATRPTPAEPIPTSPDEPDDLNIESPPTETSSGDEQALILPDADAEVPSLEVGYEDHEDLELDLISDHPQVDRIEIVSSETRGKDLDGIPGHDGLELMIQAIDGDGDAIDESGELTVTVSDNLVGEIGKWTFLPNELELFLSRDELGNYGTLLHLPWSDRIPVSKKVEVKVVMLIGRIQYVATQLIKIKPPTGQASSRPIVGWTGSDDRWLSNSKSPFSTKRDDSFKSRPSGSFLSRPGSSFESESNSRSPSTAVQRPQWKPVR